MKKRIPSFFKGGSMVYAVRKKYVVLLIIILVFSSLVPGLAVWAVNKNSKPTIVLDAGHGGYDGGVTGLKSNVKESTINLELVKLLKGYLESDGYNVVLTRSKDEALGDTKRSDMKERIKIINSSRCKIMVSIHVNFYPSKYRRGIQTFFNKKEDEELARSLQESLNDSLNKPTINRNFSALWGDYYILANSNVPATIVETGFLSNSEDEELLLTPSYRMKLAYQIFIGIKRYLSSDTLAN